MTIKKYNQGGKVKSRLKAVEEGRVSPKFVTMEMWNRLKAELKALKKKRK